MEQLHLDYSTKNIPYPSLHSFRLDLTNRIIDFIRRLRWKTFFFKRGSNNNQNNEKFGFRTQKNPPADTDLKEFEDGLFYMVRSIDFLEHTNHLQNTMRKDIYNIKRSKNHIFVKADKSRNIYKVPVKEYDLMLRNNVTQKYKVDDNNTEQLINKDILETTPKLKISGRVSKIAQKQCYILLKDTKEDFLNKKQARVINPAKSELGRVSKVFLQNIVEELKTKLGVNLWSCTTEAIKWFEGINSKKDCTFIQFDIVDFYPSISSAIFEKALDFARNTIHIDESQLDVIRKCRKGILFHDNRSWVKKDSDSSFDVPMGGLDSAQIADFIGVYILDTIGRITDKANIGLYRDDGLLVIPNSNGPKTSNIQKRLVRAFRFLGFKVEIKSNIRSVNFLDVTLDLPSGSYKPFSKDNANPSYVHIESNHPHHILKQIPRSVNFRINRNSSSRRVFNNCKNIYTNALAKSGYNQPKDALSYLDKDVLMNNPGRKNRPRKVVWFNPPYCRITNFSIARYFIHLVDSCFPFDHPLKPICNRMNLKVSYSCCKNISQIISNHNSSILSKFHESKSPTDNTNDTTTDNTNCNCRNRNNCPLNNECLTANVVYRARIACENNPSKYKIYIGACQGAWKYRYYVHSGSFRNRNYNQTALSKHYWWLKDRGKRPIISWEIITKANTPRSLKDKCSLCLEEMTNILLCNTRLLLNKRRELMAKCRHTRSITPGN